MSRTLLWLSFALWPLTANAQDWATRELCHAPIGPASQIEGFDSLQAASKDIPNGTGRFWQITSPDGAVSHLWGTFHASQAQILDLPDQVKDAIAKSRLAAFEVDYTYPDRASIFAEWETEGRYRMSDDPFAAQEMLDLSYLGDAALWVEDRLFASGTASEDALFILTYAGLAELILSDPCQDFTQYTLPTQDDLIQTYAHIAGADIIGLENPSDLMTDLAEIPETAKSIVAVYAGYLQPPRDAASFHAFASLYLEGRLGAMFPLDMAQQTAVYGDAGRDHLAKTDDYLIRFRNERFVARALPELVAGDTFLAVGAAHLPGKSGLVEMIRAEGFTVTRVPLPGEAP